MNRLIEKTVFSGFVTACRLAIWPTRISPSLVKATTEGVMRLPSWLGTTRGSPPSITATTEFVVPRSMPITFAMLSSLWCLCSLVRDRDPVVDLGDSGRRPRGPLRLLPLRPRAKDAPQDDPAAVHLNRDPRGVRLRAAHQRLFDLFLEVRGRHRRLDGDPIEHALDAGQAPDGLLSVLLLELPVHGAPKCDEAFGDRDVDLVGRHEH